MSAAQPQTFGFKRRCAACLSQRHRVEQITFILGVLIIQQLVDLHAYTALGVASGIAWGLRDILLLMMFAEEFELAGVNQP